MLVPLRRPPNSLTLRALRLLHASARISDYSPRRHPYSLDEFRNDADTLEYQWKLHRQQLDAFNDAFWRDVRLSFLTWRPRCHGSFLTHSVQTNTRFEVAKAATVDGLPPHATAQQREEQLGEFYRSWVLQEATRQEEYNAEWRRRSMQEIKLAARVSFQKLKARFTS
ncbi:hypothetical protein BC826DRAFT_987632 [Russula brevipes]|nr:hypothetical protein BC826DRAFT_987632 [Russula brevipes]